MCAHGDTVDVRVFVPARLAADGVDTWKWKPIDRCIAPLVTALTNGGCLTVASCCGHGKGPGSIVLADGRDLQIVPFDTANYQSRPTCNGCGREIFIDENAFGVQGRDGLWCNDCGPPGPHPVEQ